MAPTNDGINDARKNKKDEFYTQLCDIEQEMKRYRKFFNNKIVLCNCDDPRISNFFFYFSHNFHKLKLKQLITICYKNKQMDLFSKHDSKRAIWLEYNGEMNKDKIPNMKKTKLHKLKGDGDFRSDECIKILKQANIVVTNPPFSLFREYVDQLIRYRKKFIIIGHQNAIGYKEIFPLIKNNKIWLGYGFKGGATHFITNYKDTAASADHKKGMVRVSGVHWFTNLDIEKRHEKLILYKKYSSKDYPKFVNYDAINVDVSNDVPENYGGNMGVPVTFMNKYNPDQFEIIDANTIRKNKNVPFKKHGLIKDKDSVVQGNPKPKYVRIVIRHKAASKARGKSK